MPLNADRTRFEAGAVLLIILLASGSCRLDNLSDAEIESAQAMPDSAACAELAGAINRRSDVKALCVEFPAPTPR